MPRGLAGGGVPRVQAVSRLRPRALRRALHLRVQDRLGRLPVQQGPQLLHQPPALPQRGHVLQHRGRLHLLLSHRLLRAQLRDQDREQVSGEPLQEQRRVPGKNIFTSSILKKEIILLVKSRINSG